MRTAVLLFGLLASLHGAISDQRLVEIFSPFRIDRAALSPNGRYVAYTLREGDIVSVLIAAVDAPDHALTKARAATDSHAEIFHEAPFYHEPAEVRWLDWLDDDHLAVLTNTQFLVVRGCGQQSRGGILYRIDRDSGEGRKIHDAKDEAGNIRVLFIHPEEPGKIVVQQGDKLIQIVSSSGARPRTIDETELRRLTAVHRERRATARASQRDSRELLRRLLPAHDLDLRHDRADSGDRALYLAQSIADPGGFIVHEPASNRVWDFLRRSAADSGQRALKTVNFEFPGTDVGPPCSGLLVYPVDPRIQRAPLVIWMDDLPGRAADRRYRTEVQALAEFGFAVAVIDQSKQMTTTSDGVAAHFARTIDLLADHFPVSRRSVALVGKRIGAARMLTVAARPVRAYRAVVALLPDFEPSHSHSLSRAFIRSGDIPENSRVADCAFLFCSWPGPPKRVLPSHGATFAAAELLQKRGATVQVRKESDEMRAGQPAALAATFRAVESFLNEQLYQYSAKLGEIEVLASDVPPPQR